MLITRTQHIGLATGHLDSSGLPSAVLTERTLSGERSQWRSIHSGKLRVDRPRGANSLAISTDI